MLDTILILSTSWGLRSPTLQEQSTVNLGHIHGNGAHEWAYLQ